jgi:3-amino-4-hydroxybenzoic acid synthase
MSLETTDQAAVVAEAPAAPPRRAPATRHFAWIDVRETPGERRRAAIDAAAAHGLDGVVSDDVELLGSLPPSLRRVWLPPSGGLRDGAVDVPIDVLLLTAEAVDELAAEDVDRAAERGAFVDVHDAASLATACRAARFLPWTVISFADPTKIPLEIVLATADNASGRTVTVVHDAEEAAVVFGVLEQGSDGVLLAAQQIAEIAAVGELCRDRIEPLRLCEFVVEGIAHVGAGDRACVDACSLLEKDEGMLVGSFSNALLLACSETHPLPYMPTRPFRVNAGAVHSYLLSSPDRTNYLSELRAGSNVLAVRVDGSVRRVGVGRVKIERRPLLRIEARGPADEPATLIVQDDWHVRMLGPEGAVHNVTALERGDVLLGYLPPQARHVGIAVDEFCTEQ